VNHKIDDIRYHETKRLHSFDRLNDILTKCSKGICPTINKEDQYYLVDISLDGFMLDRAYYFFVDDLYFDAQGRYLEAKKLIQNVLKCKKNPKFNDTTIASFELDYNQMFHKEKSVKNRKAFWISQKYEFDNTHDQRKDYCGACGFVKTVIDVHKQRFPYTENQLRIFIDKNSHVANGMDLMRFCYIRQLKANFIETKDRYKKSQKELGL
jgi:tetratricopeptide (TPR) repeat protein